MHGSLPQRHASLPLIFGVKFSAQKSSHGSLSREVKSWAHWSEGYYPNTDITFNYQKYDNYQKRVIHQKHIYYQTHVHYK